MIKRIAEARSIITHGLGENATDHEKYMSEFREMVAQIERIYPNWLRDKGIDLAASVTIRHSIDVICMNAVRDQNDPEQWIRCGWRGKIDIITDPCPRCLRSGVLAPFIEVPKPVTETKECEDDKTQTEARSS